MFPLKNLAREGLSRKYKEYVDIPIYKHICMCYHTIIWLLQIMCIESAILKATRLTYNSHPACSIILT